MSGKVKKHKPKKRNVALRQKPIAKEKQRSRMLPRILPTVLGFCTMLGALALWPKLSLTPSSSGPIESGNPFLITFTLKNDSFLEFKDITFNCAYPAIFMSEGEFQELAWQGTPERQHVDVDAGESKAYKCRDFLRTDFAKYTAWYHPVFDERWQFTKSKTLTLRVNNREFNIVLEGSQDNIIGVRDAINRLKTSVIAGVWGAEMTLSDGKPAHLFFLTLITDDTKTTVQLDDGTEHLLAEKDKKIEHQPVEEIRTVVSIAYKYSWIPWHLNKRFYFRTVRGPDNRFYLDFMPSSEAEKLLANGDLPSTPSQDEIDAEPGQSAFDMNDYETAFREWESLAKKGNRNAEFGLGVLYKDGKSVPRRLDIAFYWFQRAAEQKHVQAECQLGIAYYRGLGTQRNIESAIHWITQASRGGDHEAQFTLGSLLLVGKEIPRDAPRAIGLLKKAADEGFSPAAALLGDAYFKGLDVEQNIPRGIRYLQWGSRGGDPHAQYELGLIYENGMGVSQNYKKAAEWFWRAADQGSVLAQEAIAQLLLSPQFPISCPSRCNDRILEAYVWASIAANKGSRTGGQIRDDLKKRLTKEQYGNAMKQVEVWVPKIEFHASGGPPVEVGSWPSLQ